MFLVFMCPLYTCFPVSQCFSSFLKAQSLWAIFLHRALCIGINLLFLGRRVRSGCNYWQHFPTEGTELLLVLSNSMATAKACSQQPAPPRRGRWAASSEWDELPAQRAGLQPARPHALRCRTELLHFTENRATFAWLGVLMIIWTLWQLSNGCDFRFEKHYPKLPHKVLM